MALQRKGVLDGTYGETEKAGAAAEIASADTATAALPSPSTPTPTPAPAASTTAPSSHPDGSVRNDGGAGGSTTERNQPGTRQAPVATAQPLRTTAKAKRTQGRGDRAAWDAVKESYQSAKRRRGEWTTTGIRIAEEVKVRLGARRAQDEERYNVSFAETHYVDAALSLLPDDSDLAMRWVDEYLDSLTWGMPESTGTTGRVRSSTLLRFKKLTRSVRETSGYGRIGHLQTVAVIRLLDALDRRDSDVDRDIPTVELDG